MASSPDLTSMALFCDFENVALGVRDTHHEKFDIKLVLERLLLKGSIVVKKAYCDWERYKGFKATMHEANFELIEIPHVRQSGKNSADIRLVVDALDLCYTKAHVNTFVIISGDSDFSPLVSKLRENNKQVIGVGVKQSTSDLLTANCDEFIFYDDLVREGQRTSTRRAPAAAPNPGRRQAAPSANPEDDRKREETDIRRSKAVDLAVQTFEALASERGDGGKLWASVLKEAIKRRKPDFNESYYGFRNFGSLLEEAQARGFLELGRDEKSNAYVFRNPSAGQNAAPADAAPVRAAAGEPAAPEVLPITHRPGAAEPRGRSPRTRGGRRGAPDRHDFEPTVAVEPPAPFSEQEEDDAAERFADAARDAQATLDAVLPEALLVEAGGESASGEPSADAPAPREPGARRGRGGRGRGGAGRRDDESRAGVRDDESRGGARDDDGAAMPVAAPAQPARPTPPAAPEEPPAPAALPAAGDEPAPAPARKSARKTAARKAPSRPRAARKTAGNPED